MKFSNSQLSASAGKVNSIRRSLSAGFTFMEMMIATTIGLMAMSALGTLSLYTARSFLAMSNYSELSQQSRNALDLMTGEIRQANRLIWLIHFIGRLGWEKVSLLLQR
jgi:type II secretory pathway component PulJ